MAAELTVIWWRDIPAQVTAQSGRERSRVQLSDRFQEAIDTAATRVGLIGTDEYMGEWHKETRPCSDDLEAEAKTEAERLELEYTDEVLDELSKTGALMEGE
jgi:cvfA/B/C family virulence factor